VFDISLSSHYVNFIRFAKPARETFLIRYISSKDEHIFLYSSNSG